MNTKIAVVGAGHVGSHVARALAAGQAADEIVLIDLLPDKAKAQAMDIADALSFPPVKTRVRAGDHTECESADITVVAEKPRLSVYIGAMRANMAQALGAEVSEINIKATTEEGLGIAGKGVACHAVCLLEKEQK